MRARAVTNPNITWLRHPPHNWDRTTTNVAPTPLSPLPIECHAPSKSSPNGSDKGADRASTVEPAPPKAGSLLAPAHRLIHLTYSEELPLNTSAPRH
jgi:hypothetical protein